MAVVRGQRDDLGREDGRERMRILRPVDANHRFDAGDLSRLCRDRRGIGAEQRDGDLGAGDRPLRT